MEGGRAYTFISGNTIIGNNGGDGVGGVVIEGKAIVENNIISENTGHGVSISTSQAATVTNKTINNNPEKYFTEDIMQQLDTVATKEFSYGGGEENEGS